MHIEAAGHGGAPHDRCGNAHNIAAGGAGRSRGQHGGGGVPFLATTVTPCRQLVPIPHHRDVRHGIWFANV